MNKDKKAKQLKTVGDITSVIAHIVLALSILSVFTLPLIGLAIGFVGIVLYIMLLAVAELARQSSYRLSGIDIRNDPDVMKKKRRDKITRSILLVFLVIVALIIFFFTR